jgi:hypothetical protein
LVDASRQACCHVGKSFAASKIHLLDLESFHAALALRQANAGVIKSTRDNLNRKAHRVGLRFLSLRPLAR